MFLSCWSVRFHRTQNLQTIAIFTYVLEEVESKILLFKTSPITWKNKDFTGLEATSLLLALTVLEGEEISMLQKKKSNHLQ